MDERLRHRAAAVAFLVTLAFLYPTLAVVDELARHLGPALLPLHLFAVWLLAVVAMALLSRRPGRGEEP